ncbi:hypothetical protein THTE_0114 [Thermogutta terrifontis]|uniref:Uncharacterized protein n=1 Tax=Thermogutta terrifontis TaxID=1331910 RepID=A0A286R9T3_9BACT|nr:hypothetical protein THTE_0114 [Thermogutta terrifontis]
MDIRIPVGAGKVGMCQVASAIYNGRFGKRSGEIWRLT